MRQIMMGIEMKTKTKYAAEKTIGVAKITALLGAVVFTLLFLLGLWDKALVVSGLFMVAAMLLQVVQEWAVHRSLAVLGLCLSAFVFALVFVV